MTDGEVTLQRLSACERRALFDLPVPGHIRLTNLLITREAALRSPFAFDRP